MAKMRAIQVAKAGGPLELVEREIPTPGAGKVRVKVQACGVCHSDTLAKEGRWPGLQYPRVPGHEVVGVVDAVGPGVAGWTVGQRVGVGWHGGHCGRCDSCRRGDFFACQVALQVTGITYDGGYADYMIAPVEGAGGGARRIVGRGGRAADVRGSHDVQRAAEQRGAGGGRRRPFSGWAGSVIWACSSPRRWGSRRWASRAGRTRNRWPENSVRGITSTARRRIRRRNWRGWAAPKVILATVTNGEAMTATLGGLGVNGTLLVVGASQVDRGIAGPADYGQAIGEGLVFRHVD